MNPSFCGSCKSRTCPNGHGLVARICDCCKHVLNNGPIFSCYACNFIICSGCASAGLHGCTPTVSTVKVEVKPEVVVEKKEESKGGLDCLMCKKNAVLLVRVDNSKRVPKCCECKGSSFEFIYRCSNCDIEVCEPCVKKSQEKALEIMGNFMSSSGSLLQGLPQPGGFNQGPPQGFNQGPPQGFNQGPPQGFNQGPPQQGFNQGPPQQGFNQGPPQGFNQGPPQQGGFNQGPGGFGQRGGFNLGGMFK